MTPMISRKFSHVATCLIRIICSWLPGLTGDKLTGTSSGLMKRSLDTSGGASRGMLLGASSPVTNFKDHLVSNWIWDISLKNCSTQLKDLAVHNEHYHWTRQLWKLIMRIRFWTRGQIVMGHEVLEVFFRAFNIGRGTPFWVFLDFWAQPQAIALGWTLQSRKTVKGIPASNMTKFLRIFRNWRYLFSGTFHL